MRRRIYVEIKTVRPYTPNITIMHTIYYGSRSAAHPSIRFHEFFAEYLYFKIFSLFFQNLRLQPSLGFKLSGSRLFFSFRIKIPTFWLQIFRGPFRFFFRSYLLGIRLRKDFGSFGIRFRTFCNSRIQFRGGLFFAVLGLKWNPSVRTFVQFYRFFRGSSDSVFFFCFLQIETL